MLLKNLQKRKDYGTDMISLEMLRGEANCIGPSLDGSEAKAKEWACPSVRRFVEADDEIPDTAK